MKTAELAKQTVQNGLTPIRLAFFEAKTPQERLLRSILVLETLQLGVLTPEQYRFVARRTKQGDALVERHLQLLFSRHLDLIGRGGSEKWVTVPVFPRVLVSGAAQQMLFAALARHSKVDPGRVCIEVSSDVLFEDFDIVRSRVADLRSLGVKFAVSEVGDDFCPLTRLAELRPDFVFADSLKKEEFDLEKGTNLAQFLHLWPCLTFLPCPSEGQKLAFDGAMAGTIPWEAEA